MPGRRLSEPRPVRTSTCRPHGNRTARRRRPAAHRRRLRSRPDTPRARSRARPVPHARRGRPDRRRHRGVDARLHEAQVCVAGSAFAFPARRDGDRALACADGQFGRDAAFVVAQGPGRTGAISCRTTGPSGVPESSQPAGPSSPSPTSDRHGRVRVRVPSAGSSAPSRTAACSVAVVVGIARGGPDRCTDQVRIVRLAPAGDACVLHLTVTASITFEPPLPS